MNMNMNMNMRQVFKTAIVTLLFSAAAPPDWSIVSDGLATHTDHGDGEGNEPLPHTGSHHLTAAYNGFLKFANEITMLEEVAPNSEQAAEKNPERIKLRKATSKIS